MFADVVINTSPVFTGNVALLAPAGTVTLEGTLAAKLLLASATRAPPAGAGVLSVTVPVEDCSPPTTVDGFKLIDATVGSGTGFTVSVAVLVVPEYAALIATVVGAVTALVLTMKLAVFAPAATVTLAGTRAANVLLLESDTTAPPDGAALLNVTVPVDDCVPPVTLVGLSASADNVTGGGGAGFTVSAAVLVVPPYAALIVTAVETVTALVLTVKLAVVAPAARVTLVGTRAAVVLLLESETTAPPDGAAPLNVTVPVEDCVPPVTLVGLSASADNVTGGGAAGFTVSAAVLVVPAYAALIVTAVETVTALVLTVEVAVVAPAATLTLAGTRAAVVLLLESATTAPPDGAAPVNVTVPVEDCVPPITLVGFSASVERVTAADADGARSNSHTAGFGSLKGTTTNFVGDTTYATALPPFGDVRFTGPLPFAGDELTEYVAANDAPDCDPLASPISTRPVRLPVGLAPFAENSPEKTFTLNAVGSVATPA